jgi:AcrR family transcriptional regulator
MIKATRGLIAREGSQWTTTERIHEVTIHPTRGRPVQLATMRYYFGNRERLFIQVARYEHLRQLDGVRRAFRELQSEDDLAPLLARLAGDEDHYRVTLGLLEAMQTMPELAEVQRELWADWRAKMRELVADLQDRAIVRPDLDPETVALLWSAITLGLAVHRYVEPRLAIPSVLALAERYAASLPAGG